LISPENRSEFDDLGVDELRKRVEASTYDPEKLRQAREYLHEHDPAWASVELAKVAGRRATIALYISGISAIAVVATFIGPYIASKFQPQLTAYGQQIYDSCLAQRGNTTACDALIRMMQRAADEQAMKKEAGKMLAAGSSKREVAEWARKQGLSNIDISNIAGIPLSDLEAGKY